MAAYEKYLTMDSDALDQEIERQKSRIHSAKTEIRLLKKLKIAVEATTPDTVSDPQTYQG